MWALERRVLKPQFWNHNFEIEPQHLVGSLPHCSQAIPSGLLRGWDVCQEVGASPVSAWGSGIPLLAASDALLHPPVPGSRWPRDAAAPTHPGLPRGRQPGAAAAGLLLIPHGAKSGTSPPRSAVLPSHKATVREADYPRPDVTFCSRRGAGTERVCVCTFQAVPGSLPSPQLQHEDPGEPASIYCFSTLFFQELSFLVPKLRSGTLKNVLLK